MAASIATLRRYPVKGLAGEALDHVTLAAGDGISGDRRFAIAPARTAYDDARPRWLRKESFVMLMRDGDEALARLRCAYEQDGRVLVATPPGSPARRLDLASASGRAETSAMLNAFLGSRRDGPVRVVPAGALSLTDIPESGLSVVNLASVADFARRVGRPVDALRFRANVYVDGLAPWAEREWIGGRTIRAG